MIPVVINDVRSSLHIKPSFHIWIYIWKNDHALLEHFLTVYSAVDNEVNNNLHIMELQNIF